MNITRFYEVRVDVPCSEVAYDLIDLVGFGDYYEDMYGSGGPGQVVWEHLDLDQYNALLAKLEKFE